MTKIIMLVILLPFFAGAQSYRSANELAHETVKDYIEKKLFQDQPYKAGNFGKLQTLNQQSNGSRWYIRHEFEILESNYVNNEKIIVAKKHSFVFYLDKKMKVIRADTSENLL